MRGPDGKFAKRTEAPEPKAAPAAPAAKAAPQTETTPPAVDPKATTQTPAPAPAVVTEVKAPQSWKPAAREHWAKLPPEVQQEAVRLENETKAVLRESADARKHFEAFRQVVAPHEQAMRANGIDPIKQVAGFFQTEAILRTAPAPQKAQLMAHLIKSYGIPVEALAAALDGQPAQAQPQAVDPASIAQQVERTIMERMQQQQAQVEQQRAAAAIEEFRAKAEFLDDVGPQAAALLEAAQRAGQPMTLQDAYDQACWANKEIRAILMQREESTRAANAQASTQRALAASVSVKSQPGVVAPPPAKGIRGVLEEAWSKVEAGKR